MRRSLIRILEWLRSRYMLLSNRGPESWVLLTITRDHPGLAAGPNPLRCAISRKAFVKIAEKVCSKPFMMVHVYARVNGIGLLADDVYAEYVTIDEAHTIPFSAPSWAKCSAENPQ